MKIEELTFPLTAEAFMAFQCELNGKPVDESWWPVLNDLVPNINVAYECHDRGALDATLEHVDAGISKFADDPVLLQALKSARWWFVYAWERGRKDAERAVAV